MEEDGEEESVKLLSTSGKCSAPVSHSKLPQKKKVKLADGDEDEEVEEKAPVKNSILNTPALKGPKKYQTRMEKTQNH